MMENTSVTFSMHCCIFSALTESVVPNLLTSHRWFNSQPLLSLLTSSYECLPFLLSFFPSCLMSSSNAPVSNSRAGCDVAARAFTRIFFLRGNKLNDLHIHFQEMSCAIPCGQSSKLASWRVFKLWWTKKLSKLKDCIWRVFKMGKVRWVRWPLVG